MSWLTGIKSFFAFDGVANSALKIVDKIAGTDWTPKEKASFMLEYQQATKHQSPARRFIALAFTLGFALFGATYLLAGITHYIYIFFATGGDTLAEIAASQNIAEIKAKPLLQLQNDMLTYCKSTIMQPLNIILGFYFLVDIGSKFKK